MKISRRQFLHIVICNSSGNSYGNFSFEISKFPYRNDEWYKSWSFFPFFLLNSSLSIVTRKRIVICWRQLRSWGMIREPGVRIIERKWFCHLDFSIPNEHNRVEMTTFARDKWSRSRGHGVWHGTLDQRGLTEKVRVFYIQPRDRQFLRYFWTISRFFWWNSIIMYAADQKLTITC